MLSDVLFSRWRCHKERLHHQCYQHTNSTEDYPKSDRVMTRGRPVASVSSESTDMLGTRLAPVKAAMRCRRRQHKYHGASLELINDPDIMPHATRTCIHVAQAVDARKISIIDEKNTQETHQVRHAYPPSQLMQRQRRSQSS